MGTKPILYDDSRPAEAIRIPAGVARRIGARLLHEAREALPPTIFFFVGFNFIVFTTNLLVAEYAVAVSSFMLATVAALVVGKAVLVANAMPLLRRYDRAPLLQPILFKTAFYWVTVFFARLLERFVHFSVIERNPPSDFLQYLVKTFSWHRFSAISLWILVLFLIYVTGVGIRPPLRPWRAAAAVLHLPSVRAAAQSATADPGTPAAQPAHGRAFDWRVPRPDQPRAPRIDRYPAAARAEIGLPRRRRSLRCDLLRPP